MSMSVQLWEVLTWIGGTVGVVGFIAAWILFPAAFSVVLKGIMAMFGFVLNYRIGCALVAAIVAGVAVDYARHSHDDAVHAAQTAAFNKAQDARDAGIAADTRKLVTKEFAEAAAANAATDKEVKEFHDALPAVVPETGNPFRVGTDACRLRKLAGETDCEPVRAKRVPKAHATVKPASHWGGFRLPGFGGAGARPAQ